jgi:hypothetical protein
MHGIARFGFATYRRTSAALLASVLAAFPASAAQIDIVGPSLSQNFGGKVAVLPNGNIVVADYKWNTYQGAVYLYSPTRVLISTLTGSNTFDQVGSSITLLKNGNFVVSSPYWNNNVGEATWVNGTTGLRRQPAPPL